MARHNELGKRGEQLAAEYLIKKGYRILETNWHNEKEEIDIIALDKNELVITEVKTRSTSYFGDPDEAVTPAKANRLIHAAETYLELKNMDMDVRYDIISIILNRNTVKINHIKDAFFAGDF